MLPGRVFLLRVCGLIIPQRRENLNLVLIAKDLDISSDGVVEWCRDPKQNH